MTLLLVAPWPLANRSPSPWVPLMVLPVIVALLVPPGPNEFIRIPAQPAPQLAPVMLFPVTVPVVVPEPPLRPNVMPLDPPVLLEIGLLLVTAYVNAPSDAELTLRPFVLLNVEPLTVAFIVEVSLGPIVTPLEKRPFPATGSPNVQVWTLTVIFAVRYEAALIPPLFTVPLLKVELVTLRIDVPLPLSTNSMPVPPKSLLWRLRLVTPIVPVLLRRVTAAWFAALVVFSTS